MLLTLPQEPLERALQSAGERKSKEDRDQRERTWHSLTRASRCARSSLSLPRRSALPVIRPRAALQPSHAPLSPGPFLPALSPVSLPASPAPRSPDSPKPRALPGSPQALPVPGSPLTSRLPPAGKQLTAPCYSPPSLRLSEEAPNRALRLAHMAYAEYRHPNNHRRKSRHSSLP